MINIITIACMAIAAAIWLMAVAVGTFNVMSIDKEIWESRCERSESWLC